MQSRLCVAFALLACLAGTSAPAPVRAAGSPVFSVVGRYATGLGELSGETVAYEQDRMFVTNSTDNSLDIVDIADPAAPVLIKRVSLAPYGAGPNSVDAFGALVAVAVESSPKTSPGRIVLLDRDGKVYGYAQAGALPDMLAFTPDGKKILAANEGEPSGYGQPGAVDPEGSITILTVTVVPGQLRRSWTIGTTKTVHFRDFNVGQPRHAELPAGIRLFGPGATVARDLEPESIAFSADGRQAFVSLQENNALAVIDVPTASVASIRALGLKDHNGAGAGLDPSDRDSSIAIANWPVKGMYQPDAVAAYQAGGQLMLVTANEGDARDYAGLAEEVRVGSGSYALDPTAFPTAATLKNNARLGRLTVTNATGDTDGDGDFDEIHVFGSRGFSIWNAATGAQVYDSGDRIEQITAAALPANFNASNTSNAFDDRSDNKGPEPEGVTVGRIDGRDYAFVGLERIGGVMVFDVTDPTAPTYVQYVNNRNFGQTPPGPDSGAEIVRFVDAARSPTGQPLILVANEVSGSVTIIEATPAGVLAAPDAAR